MPFGVVFCGASNLNPRIGGTYRNGPERGGDWGVVCIRFGVIVKQFEDLEDVTNNLVGWRCGLDCEGSSQATSWSAQTLLNHPREA